MKFFAPAMFAFCLCANASTLLFSDFGPGNSYSTDPMNPGSVLQGSNGNTRQSITQAREFTVSGAGSFDVTQIDLAVNTNGGGSSFMAAIFTNNGAQPGTQIGPSFDLTALASGCCETDSAITGVTLTGGVQYWMVLGPQSLTDNSENIWRVNNQGSTSLQVASINGGQSWVTENGGPAPNLAFDVLGNSQASGVPEPNSLILMTSGLFAAVVTKRLRA